MEALKNIFDQLSKKLTLHGNSAAKMPSVDLHSHSFELVGLIVAILVAAFLINFILSHTFLGQRYRIFVAPGVILHELSHAFFCMLTGARIKKIALFEKDGGYVEHEPSKLPVIGQVLISFAPFLFGALAIFFLSKYLGIKESQINFSSISVDTIIRLIGNTFKQLNFGQWQTWAIVYVVLSIAVTMTPSRKDFENVFLSVLLIALVIFAFFYFIPSKSGAVSYKLSQFVLTPSLFMLLNSVLVLLILALLLSIVIYVLSLAIKRK